MSILHFEKILEVKRYSRNTIESYVSVVKMAQQRFKRDLNLVNEIEPSSNKCVAKEWRNVCVLIFLIIPDLLADQ